MAKIFNSLSDSAYPNIQTGRVVNVGASNVYPTTLSALPTTGLTFPVQHLDNYERFNVAQTGAGTDFISLPADLPVGSYLELYAVSACKVEALSGTINGVAATTDITLAAGSLSILRKTTSTAWILTQFSSAGAVTAPIA